MQGRGLGWHGVHVVQARVGALFLRSQAKPLGLWLQGRLLAHRAAMVKGGLGPLLLLLGLLQLLAQLVFGDRL